jgi:hypothetical protein
VTHHIQVTILSPAAKQTAREMPIPNVVAVDKEFGDSHDMPVEHVEVSQDIIWTEEEEKKLVRKIDLYLLPNIWLMYLLSYMDRTK